MTEQQHDALSFDLFEGDYGAPGDTCLRDKIVKCRKEHICHICGGGINPGELARSSQWKFDGELHSYHCCSACVEAMAKSVNCDYDQENGEEDPIHDRYDLGEKRRMEAKE
ncbi:hypothetical protein [Serratia nematodiphila]|uniref:hypothetical protein n=1 Tax=Serratia nematodiphila TaxID=458197 RepID=UPI0011D8C208|nr:hypothetical protein [Serratia nematodiphila]TXE56999.1 hypothetical protein FOT58_19770 [Serratia nematodiphila]